MGDTDERSFPSPINNCVWPGRCYYKAVIEFERRGGEELMHFS